MAESYKSEFLLKEYISRHDLLLFYNDLMVHLLKLADEKHLSSVTINFKNECKTREIDKLEKGEILDWLIDNGYKKEAYKVSKSHIFFSLLRDFTYYMHESFDCSERAKVTLAFTLCRKPIKDNLFYFCWLLVDAKDFTQSMLSKEPEEYDVTKISVNKKKEIINKASEAVLHKNHSEDVLFNIIYSRSSSYGLSSIWDQSIHLVTENKNYPTEKGNLNFIFATDTIWKRLWETYYEKIPYIMHFAMRVIISIFESIFKPDKNTIDFNKFVYNIKYIKTNSNNFDFTPFLEGIESIKKTCEYCKKEYPLSGEVGTEFINDFIFSCPYCDKKELVGKYFLLNEGYII